MGVLHLVRIGMVDSRILNELREDLPSNFQMRCEILPGQIDPEFAFHPARQQYNSSGLLARVKSFVQADTWRILGVTQGDLFIPILTFVFGEAELGNRCAVVSTERLRQEFYGLPPDPRLLRQRLHKEAVHELGHTLDLHHCEDYRCVMASSHSVEWIDLKETALCSSCSLRAWTGMGHR